MSGSRPRIAGLVRGCHPAPCVAVTAFATGYAVTVGAGAGRALAVAAAIGTGQLCVGWSNDAIDAPRDRAAGRTDKPVGAGLVGARTLALAAGLAAAACIVLSFRLGPAAGWAHVVAVVSAVGYNAGLKSTVLSPLPYVVSFGLLPSIVTAAVAGPHLAGAAGGWEVLARTPVPHVVAAALLGVAAHAGNTVGDADADAATGVRGLPQRLGPRRSLVMMAVLVAVASLVLLTSLVPDGGDPLTGRRPLAGALLLAGVLLAVFAAVRGARPAGREAWRLTLLAVTLVIAGFLTGA